MNMQAREQPLDLPTSAGHVQGADHGQNAPLLQASDAPVNIDASESVLSAPDLPNEFKGAERALQAWQQHKFALWLYMVVSGLVIALSVQNHFIPTILPATLGQQLAMWGLLFLTWKPDRKLRNIEEFLQVQQGGSMVTALFSIALAFVFAGHKLNCFEIGQVCIYSEGIDDWRWTTLPFTLFVHAAMSIQTSHKAVVPAASGIMFGPVLGSICRESANC
ncbi:hypothetical protein WJX82_007395 [Trebouxia sp. C0006]